ncbi:class II aldolase/adducin family protein, partial [Francisella tularensis]|uniref:class II aldolase/adducin family protein n=1 Tax=Francisella tularensis TaxID=263 RepID=UPI002381CF8F
HISARLRTGIVIISPHNVTVDKVTKKYIVTITPHGEIISDNGYKVMPPAANIHVETYKARKESNAIIPTHSEYAGLLSS